MAQQRKNRLSVFLTDKELNLLRGEADRQGVTPNVLLRMSFLKSLPKKPGRHKPTLLERAQEEPRLLDGLCFSVMNQYALERVPHWEPDLQDYVREELEHRVAADEPLYWDGWEHGDHPVESDTCRPRYFYDSPNDRADHDRLVQKLGYDPVADPNLRETMRRQRMRHNERMRELGEEWSFLILPE